MAKIRDIIGHFLDLKIIIILLKYLSKSSSKIEFKGKINACLTSRVIGFLLLWLAHSFSSSFTCFFSFFLFPSQFQQSFSKNSLQFFLQNRHNSWLFPFFFTSQFPLCLFSFLSATYASHASSPFPHPLFIGEGEPKESAWRRNMASQKLASLNASSSSSLCHLMLDLDLSFVASLTSHFFTNF